MGLQRLRVRLGKEYPDSDHSARLDRRSDSYWSIEMLWTAEAVEDLKRLALAGKSASHHRRGAWRGIPQRGHRQSELDRNRSSSAVAGAPPRPARRQRARVGRIGDGSSRSAQRRRPRCPRRRPARSLARGGEGSGLALRRTRDRRDATAAVRIFVKPPVGGRSAILEAEISPIAG